MLDFWAIWKIWRWPFFSLYFMPLKHKIFSIVCTQNTLPKADMFEENLQAIFKFPIQIWRRVNAHKLIFSRMPHPIHKDISRIMIAFLLLLGKFHKFLATLLNNYLIFIIISYRLTFYIFLKILESYQLETWPT